jgi:quercetin dioxygenase-like cupin family protein
MTMQGPSIMSVPELKPGYAVPHCSVEGGARSALFHPEGYSLWQVTATIDAGSSLRWEDPHGDEALFVVSGAVEVAGQSATTFGCVIVESGVTATVRALETTRLVHFGPAEVAVPSDGLLGPPDQEGHGVHVIDEDEACRVEFARPEVAATMYSFADSTCPRCRITLFRIEAAPRTSHSHSHSEDEIIHVLGGEISVGPAPVTTGMSIAIPANRRYGYRASGDYTFLNYRRDVATATSTPGSEPKLETVATRRASPAARDGSLVVKDGGGGRLVPC